MTTSVKPSKSHSGGESCSGTPYAELCFHFQFNYQHSIPYLFSILFWIVFKNFRQNFPLTCCSLFALEKTQTHNGVFVSFTGERRVEVIQENVQKAINGKYALFCLGFGFDVSYKFLEKMALSNGGVARRIYENADAALQLQVRSKECARKTIYQLQPMSSPGSKITDFPRWNVAVEFTFYFSGGRKAILGYLRVCTLYISMVLSHQISHIQTNWETYVFLCCKKRNCPGEVDNFWLCSSLALLKKKLFKGALDIQHITLHNFDVICVCSLSHYFSLGLLSRSGYPNINANWNAVSRKFHWRINQEQFQAAFWRIWNYSVWKSQQWAGSFASGN